MHNAAQPPPTAAMSDFELVCDMLVLCVCLIAGLVFESGLLAVNV